MKIGLVGYFGYGNYGDELFLKIWRELFGYENTQAIYPGDDLSDIDRIVIGGGDIIIPSLMNNNYFRDEFLKKDVFVYGAGAPIAGKDEPNEIKKFQKFFSKVKYLSVRDEASQRWLAQRDIESVAVEDMAWCYNNEIKLPKQPGTIGVTIRQHPYFPMDLCVRICMDLITKGHRLLLIPLQESLNQTRDLHLTLQEKLTRRLVSSPCNITNYSLDVDHKWSLLHQLDGYVTMAFHGALTSLVGGVPTIMLATGNKFIQLAKKTNCPIAKDYAEYLALQFEPVDMEKVNKIKEKAKRELLDFKALVLQ